MIEESQVLEIIQVDLKTQNLKTNFIYYCAIFVLESSMEKHSQLA